MSNWNVFDEQNQLTSESPDLGRWLKIVKTTDIKDFPLNYNSSRLKILSVSLTGARPGILGGGKNLHNIFINFDVCIAMAARSSNLTTVAFEKRLSKKDMMKKQQEH